MVDVLFLFVKCNTWAIPENLWIAGLWLCSSNGGKHVSQPWVFEWVEWRSVLQLLPVIDFDAMRDMISHLIAKIPISILWVIIPAYTESPYLNPMGVVTENARSLPQPLLAIADIILNIFLQYKWISHSLIIDGISEYHGLYPYFSLPKATCSVYYWQKGIGELHSSISELHSTSYINGQSTISELH